jgi:hypothetical protein
MIRPATLTDVPRMIGLAEQKRAQYEQYQPTFWRRAVDAQAAQTPCFEKLVADESVIALVHETDGLLDGFVIAALMQAPPVYNPSGLTCMIDDFVADWSTIGSALLEAAAQEAKQRGAVQVVVVCGHLDEPKRAMLHGQGLTIASEWYVRDL